MTGTLKTYWHALVFACALLLSVSPSLPVVAQSGPIALQLKPMALTAITPNGYRGRTTVTVYLEVVDEDAFRYVCHHLPRVVDAIVVAFEQQPLTMDALVAKLESRQDELGGLIEDALGVGVFSRMHIVAGSRRRGEGTRMVRIDGGSPECQAIEEIPWTLDMPPDAARRINEIEAERAATRAAVEAAQQASMDASKPEGLGSPLNTSDWMLWLLAFLAVAGIGLMIAGYVGFKIGKKKRRDRRQLERRMANPDRRDGEDRRKAERDVIVEPDRRVRNRRGGLPSRRIRPDRRQGPRRRDD